MALERERALTPAGVGGRQAGRTTMPFDSM